MSRMLPPLRLDMEYESFYRSDLAWTGVAEFPPGYSSERHAHNSWEFILIHKGCGRITVGRDILSAQAGEMFVYPPQVEHVEQASENDPFSMKMLSILNTSDMDFMNFWPIGDASFVKIVGSWLNGAFARIIDAMLGELQRMDAAYAVRVNALSFEFLSYLAMYVEQLRGDKENSPLYAHVRHSKQFIEAHYAQNITLNDIAAGSYVSTYYLSHLFKEYTGYSPIHYLISLRMSKAQHLLTHTELSITEISQMVGYEDLQHFSNTFKKHTGFSPRAFRNSTAGERG